MQSHGGDSRWSAQAPFHGIQPPNPPNNVAREGLLGYVQRTKPGLTLWLDSRSSMDCVYGL